MTAVYRMEYDGWSPKQAIQELKANGFGEWPCTAANDYITQYILTYQRGVRRVAKRGHSSFLPVPDTACATTTGQKR